MSAISSEADEDVFSSEEEVIKSTTNRSGVSKTIQVVLKGGAPWGFTLSGGTGTQSPVQIHQVDPEGKAQGCLYEGDCILAVNGVAPESLYEGEQLIKDAFRTLTLTVWRGTSKLESSVKILRSSSFLHRSREVQERERNQSGNQDDIATTTDDPRSAEKMKPRQRRVESFHGRSKTRHSSSNALNTSPHQDPPLKVRNHLSSSSISLSSHNSSPREPTSSKNRHSFGSTSPLTHSHTVTPGRHSLPLHSLHTSRNTDILPNKQRHSSGNSTSSAGSSQRPSSRGTQNEESSRGLMSMKGWNTVQDLSQKQRPSSRVDTTNGSHVDIHMADTRLGRLSPASSSPSLAMAEPSQKKPPSPRLDLHKSTSEVNNHSQPLSPRSPAHQPFFFPKGFKKIAWPHNTDYTGGHSDDRMKDIRQSLPSNNKPFKSDLHDYQNINEVSSQAEVDPADLELQKLTQRPPREPYDPRPACSPPAPPVRDVSSLQYGSKPQAHEKYPSWPVTQPNIESEPGEPINSPTLKHAYHPQLGPVNERNSPSSERKGGDDYKRNASDPGFKKQTSLSRFMKRPTPSDQEKRTRNLESKRSAESQMEQFFSSSPGYPHPMMDQDGNRIGDEKYNIPSPPERESRAPDEKTLSEKIASIVGPHHHDSWHGSSSGYHSDIKSHDSSFYNDSPNQDYKKQSNFTSPGVRGLVDTGTNPLGSEGKSVSSSSLRFEPPRTYVVKQMVCYNTGTQTDNKSPDISSSGDRYFQEKSIQARLSSSDSDTYKQTDSQRYRIENQDTKKKERFPEDYPCNMAPMLRKLTKEYYGGKLHGSEKRLSSASSQDSSIRSPGSDIPTFVHYPGMREAESYNSVVIHPTENSLPFGRDYAESRSSISDSRHDVSGLESERNSVFNSESRSKHMRHGLDPSLYSPKYPQFHTGSRSDLNKDQNRLIMGHDKSSKGVLNTQEYPRGVPGSDSSPSMPYSTSDSRSSNSTRFSSESSHLGHSKPRHESTDSVFMDPSSPLIPGGGDGPRRPADLGTGRQMGRSASMKKAYGVFDEHSHRRQESESLSSTQSPTVVHTRSHSSSEYMRMDHYNRMHAENKHMTLIREDSLENKTQDQRWEDVVRKSKLSQAEKTSNYENVLSGNKGSAYSTKGMLPASNLKRTSSEQIRPMKDRFNDRTSARKMDNENGAFKTSDDSRSNFKSPIQSQMDLSSNEASDISFDHRPRSTSDSIPKDGSSLSPSKRHVSDSDSVSPDNPDMSTSQSPNDFNKDTNLKDVQRNAVQKYMDRVTGKSPDEPESRPDSTRKTSLTPSESFRLKYGNRAERQESLRRSRSITSRDSDYMEMKRPERQQTEWSRIRSQTGGSRPHSIGSDSSLVDPYAVTPLSSFPDTEHHQRSQSDSTNTLTQLNIDEVRSVSVADHNAEESADQSSGGITKNSLYQNVGYRPPPPVPPGGEEDQPPALPPRNYRRFSASQSDSSLHPRPIPQPLSKDRSFGYDSHSSESRGKWDDDNYAEQLRKQSRRLSEQQHMPQPMIYKTTKTSIQFTQSYKQQHVEALEATSPGGSTSSSDHFFSSRRMSGGHQPSSPNSAPSVPPLPSSKYTSSPSSPPISPKGEGLSRSEHYPETKSYHSPESKERLRVDIPTTSQSWHSRSSPYSPDPPPPPTPQKEVSVEMELPPPPPEVVENSTEHKEDKIRYAEDSFASYKSRNDRQPGVYKRSASSGDALKLLHENNNYKQQGDIQKPPRKRLQPWKSEQTVNQGDQIPEQTEVPYKDPVLSERPPRPLVSAHSSSHLLAPKPYTTPESNRSNSFNVTSSEPNSVSGHPTERQSVQDRISSIERKQSLSRERPEIRQVTPQGPSHKRPLENLSKSFTSTPPRKTFETDKFSASVSEIQLGPKSSVKSPDSSASRRAYSPDQSSSVSTSDAGPPPVDRSPGSGYPGGRRVKNRESNGQSANDSNSSNTKMSFSDSIRQSPSQSNSTETSSPSAKNSDSDLIHHSRQRSQEELECDAKVKEFAQFYGEKDPKLSSMLKNDGGRMQYMDGLFQTEIDQDLIARRSPKTSPKSSSVSKDQEALKSVTPNKEEKQEEEKSPLPANYWVSPSKALIEMNIRQSEGIGRDMTKDIDDSDKLIKTKEELVESIQKKMDKLKEEKEEVTKELEETESLGIEVQKAVDKNCKTQHEKDKFKTYIGDMEKIILLLLKVSGLLARAENSLQSLPKDTNERLKKMAVEKRDRVKQQHEDAKVLKADIEKRSEQIEVFLQEALSEEEFADYKYYVKMKSKLTIEKQELVDKIALGEEQIAALKLSIPEKH
ncbi:protein Shroom3-like isoform X1 [Saccostrea cucullata]|uniref:protein Shroom3-like isoform X1 n=1 Tax=Saccostrea cuccullata TaxID=36930 RepID=UPI002ED5EA91